MTIICKGSEAGQSESLVSRLRGLIRDYPAGIGIVKEFLQNADDAGATWVRLTLDLRNHPAERIPDSRMASLLGPALLVESDQVFTDNDLKNIQTIGEGGKLGEATKTGRFGLGFNTAYNLTDYPCFATRDIVVCFDPNEDAVAVGQRPGRQWGLIDLWRDAPDWPRAFGLQERVTNLTHTVFRLPLRTQAQAHPDRICVHPFPSDQVEAIFAEAAACGGSLLLFLHRILDLEARIIGADGSEVEYLSVRTSNPEEVKRSRSRVMAACAGRVEDLLDRWATEEVELPVEVYENTFVVVDKAQRLERWVVCSGLFLDPERKVLKSAKRMLDIGEKALPLAGAAARLSDEVGDGVCATPVNGHLYCTLPLPDEAPLNFHVNGYFDLDSSRSQLTHGSALIGDAAIRVEWNAALIQYAVTSAIVDLMVAVSDRISTNHLASYYELWPSTAKLPTGPLAELGKHLYAEMADGDFLHVRRGDESSWMNTREARVSVPQWSASLIDVLMEDGLALVDPLPPDHVLQGFKSVNMAPRAWSATELSAWLRVTDNLDCALQEAPRACLRDGSFVSELLRFCSRESMTNLKGLPLVLLADGALRVFGFDNVFMATDEVRSLFRERPGWFLDAELQKSVSLKADAGTKLFEMDVANTVLNLKTHLAPSDADTARSWEPTGKGVPNEAWLLDVVQWLRRQDLKPHAEAIKTLALIPDQSKRLVTPGHAGTPLLPEEGVPQDVRKALTAFGVPLVAGSTELLLALRALTKACQGLVWPLTAPDLIDTLEDLDGLDARVSYDSQQRQSLLTWLAAADRLQALDDDRVGKLKKLPLWPSEDGTVVAACHADVFLPSGYVPPYFIGGLTLLRPGPADAWRALLSRLGVRELNLHSYLESVFLPGYSSLEKERQVDALRWLRDEGLSSLERQADHDSARRITASLGGVPLVRSTGGENCAASALYQPNAKKALRLLGPTAVVPDMRTYADSAAKWLTLFAELGMRSTPAPADVVRRVEQLVKQAEKGLEAVEEPLLAILEYLQESWEQLPETSKATLTAQLRQPWLPALRDSSRAKRVAGFRIPDARLFRPSEVYPQHLQHQVASQAPLLTRPSGAPFPAIGHCFGNACIRTAERCGGAFQ